MSSNVSTPLLEPASSQTLQPPSPSPLASQSPSSSSSSSAAAGAGGGASSLDDIPPLSLEVLTRPDDKVAALRLVADSIAQQRQQASLSLVFHPLNLAVLAAALAAAYQYSRKQDVGMIMTLCSGVVMTYLLAIRYFTSAYLHLAEDLGWEWLAGGGGGEEGGEEDTIIASRFGKEIIGALVLRLEPGPGGAGGAATRKRSNNNNNNRGNHNPSLKGGKGIIRAWTTRLRYRRKGVGSDLLHEAIRVTREKCGRDGEVGFAKEHANSRTVLPELYNGPFRKTERLAAKTLDHALGEWDGNKRKR